MSVVVGCIIVAACLGYVVGYLHGLIHTERRRHRPPADITPIPNPYRSDR